MKERTIVALLMAGLVVCSLGAVAATHGGDDGNLLKLFIRDEFSMLKKLHSDVDLTQEQREKIHDIFKDHRNEIAGALRPVVEKRRALRDAVMAKSPDDDAIRAAANNLGKAIGEAAVLASKIKPEVGKVLTSEQREKIKGFCGESDNKVDELIERIAGHS